jgi:hypothetical protein
LIIEKTYKMKDYFSHDYNSRNDKKLVKSFMKYGLNAIGAYWCIVEMLYEEGGYLLLSEYERITFELRTDNDLINYLIHESDLFKNDGIKFWSDTAIDRLNMRIDKSEKARKSIESRWSRKNDTNVIQSNNGRNTSKVKESKVKEIEIYPFEEFWNDYDKKTGDKDKLIIKWAKLTNEEKLKIKSHIPIYKKSQPEKKFRKDPQTYFNNHSWNDEVIGIIENADVKLGIGEQIINGKRMFFNDEIPMSAPPRPSSQYTWSVYRKVWYIQ